MITKIDTHKIEYQSYSKMFFFEIVIIHLIENKPINIIKADLKTIKC